MIYDEMFNELKKYVGLSNETILYYTEENNVDETDGMHIWFEFVVTPFVLAAIKNNDDVILTKSFEFIEESLKSSDKDITELIEFSLLEGMVAEIGENIKKIEHYFGDETKKSVDSIKRYIF